MWNVTCNKAITIGQCCALTFIFDSLRSARLCNTVNYFSSCAIMSLC